MVLVNNKCKNILSNFLNTFNKVWHAPVIKGFLLTHRQTEISEVTGAIQQLLYIFVSMQTITTIDCLSFCL